MPTYFASDVHLRLDRPERSERFARWVRGLGPGDELVIGGDLCDFWFVSRESTRAGSICAGVRALMDFRGRGGELTLVAGNHDAWLGPYYERTLGLAFAPEPWERTVRGLRVHLVHGHRVGGRPAWKGIMESRAFLSGFAAAPGPVCAPIGRAARPLQRRHPGRVGRAPPAGLPELCRGIGGGAPTSSCSGTSTPRTMSGTPSRGGASWGGWQRRGSYLRIDDSGAELVIGAGPDGS